MRHLERVVDRGRITHVEAIEFNTVDVNDRSVIHAQDTAHNHAGGRPGPIKRGAEIIGARPGISPGHQLGVEGTPA